MIAINVHHATKKTAMIARQDHSLTKQNVMIARNVHLLMKQTRRKVMIARKVHSLTKKIMIAPKVHSLTKKRQATVPVTVTIAIVPASRSKCRKFDSLCKAPSLFAQTRKCGRCRGQSPLHNSFFDAPPRFVHA